MESIGKIVLIGKGTYNASTTYTHLDWVRYNGKSWVCKQDNTVGVTPTEGAYWTLIAQDGANGQDGHDGHDGQDGQGVPTGGTTGQVLAKASNTDYDTVWVNGGGGGGSDDEQLIRDTVGWTGKNIVEEFTANNDTEQYKNALFAKGELKANTDYIISFDAASGNQYYTNENLFSEVTITTTGSTVSAQARTVSSVSKSDANQYNATYGWRVLKNKVAQSSAPSFTNVMIRKATVTDSTYEPYHVPVTDYSHEAVADGIGWGNKNLLNHTVTTGTYVNVATTVNADNSITFSGTANESYDLPLVFSLVDNLHGYVLSGGNSNIHIGWYDRTAQVTKMDNESGFNDFPDSTHDYKIFVRLVNSTAYSTTLYPMLRHADITDSTYEPYHPTVKQTLRDAEVIEGKNVVGTELLSMALVGGSTTGYKLEATINGLSYVAELAHNVRYVASKGEGAGNRFRICLFSNYPTTTYESGSTEVVNNDSLHEYSFNSGTYNYAVFTVNKTDAYTYDNVKAMLRYASETDPTYEPYYIPLKDSKFDRSEQRVLGAKNLLAARLNSGSGGGLTLTKNADNSYTVNGTCNDGTASFRIDQTDGNRSDLKDYNGRYTLTIKGENGNYVSGTSCILMQVDTWVAPLAAASSNSGEATGEVNLTDCFIFLQFTQGTTFSNVKLYPMLRFASDPDNTYVPYAMTNKELTDAIGSAGSPSWSSVTSKPFNTVNSGSFTVSDNDLRLAGNRVHSISRYASDGTSTTYGYRGISASYATPTGTSNTSDAIVEYVMKQTATASSYTFTNSTAITSDRLISVYSSLDEDYETVSQSGSTVTVTFADSKNRTVAIVLK